MTLRYRIHPAIGFARVGTSEETFLGPERPGVPAGPADGQYRDAAGRLKRQAVRYRVYEYDDAAPGVAPREVTGGGGAARIDWTVHLVNAKAEWFEFRGLAGEGPAGYPAGHRRRNGGVAAADRRGLVIDPLPRTLSATGAAASAPVSKGTSGTPAGESWPPPLTGGAAVTSLGTLAVDAAGQLSVAGGFGTSGTTGPLPPGGSLDYANNDGWFDDVSDGPVTARLTLPDGSVRDADGPAWAIVAPPDYAPGVENLVTAHDLLYDLGLREFGLDPAVFDPAAGGFDPAFLPSFGRDVYPILRRALEYRFVIRQAASHTAAAFSLAALAAAPAPGEDPTNNARAAVFGRLRDPDDLGGDPAQDMPRLRGDGTGGQPAEALVFTLTRYQHFVMRQWAAGRFVADWAGSPPAPAAGVTPAGLDRAALDAACGGAFFPGIESGWTLRDPRAYAAPFAYRFRHGPEPGAMGPGSATKRMALPWQADFLECVGKWWPAQRPDQVSAGGVTKDWDRPLNSSTDHVRLVGVWSQLGVVVPDPAAAGRFVEGQRTLPEA